ncbi:MAG: uncharacterized protein QOD66_3793, partial [Solirubrobacteraceae bacterium]|nr:uncharacterized protein [Solirubrobacteraceae bacterium]
QTPATPGQVTRYDVEVFPTVDTLAPGHRLRVTVATSDFPHALASITQLPGLLGGVYALEHSAAYPSSVELPLVSAPLGSAGGLQPVGSSPLGCPAAPGSLSGRTLGPVRLGMTRAQARAAFGQSSTRGRRLMDFFCLAGSGIRAGYRRGRVVLALSANRVYALDGIRPGARLRTARRLRLGAPFRIGLNSWYLTPARAVRGVLKVRHGTIEEVGIADGGQVGPRRQARRFLTSFR